MQPIESILPQQAKDSPSYSDRQAPKCLLCSAEFYESGKLCGPCRSKVSDAAQFNRDNFVIPARYKGVVDSKAVTDCILVGRNGSGKTHRAYASLQEMVRFDPRLKIAAYCWPDVLIALRRGMGNNEYELGWRIVDALRVADVAFIDDLGAENLTVGGESWRTEQLYAILNKRYNEKAATILTSNVGSSELGDLASYLGPRIFSRICEWLTLVKMDEKDRRME